MKFNISNVRKLEDETVEFEYKGNKYIGSWSDDGGYCGECIFSGGGCGYAIKDIFGEDRRACGNYKFENVEVIKMREKMIIQAKDLVVVVNDEGCSNIKNGDIHHH